MVDMLAHDTAQALASLLTRRQRQDLLVPAQDALDNMRTACRPDAAWCNLADALNVAEQLARAGIASDRLSEFTAGQHALAAVYQRNAAGRGWTLYAAEITALDEALVLHRIQLEHCTQGELREAIETVRRRMAGALRGSPPAGATVCVGGLRGAT